MTGTNLSTTIYDGEKKQQDEEQQGLEKGSNQKTDEQLKQSGSDIIKNTSNPIRQVQNTHPLNPSHFTYRPIQIRDRDQIQKLHEEWFPVKYQSEFYDDLAHGHLAGNPLYTCLAIYRHPDEKEQNKDSHHSQQKHSQQQAQPFTETARTNPNVSCVPCASDSPSWSAGGTSAQLKPDYCSYQDQFGPSQCDLESNCDSGRRQWMQLHQQQNVNNKGGLYHDEGSLFASTFGSTATTAESRRTTNNATISMDEEMGALSLDERGTERYDDDERYCGLQPTNSAATNRHADNCRNNQQQVRTHIQFGLDDLHSTDEFNNMDLDPLPLESSENNYCFIEHDNNSDTTNMDPEMNTPGNAFHSSRRENARNSGASDVMAALSETTTSTSTTMGEGVDMSQTAVGRHEDEINERIAGCVVGSFMPLSRLPPAMQPVLIVDPGRHCQLFYIMTLGTSSEFRMAGLGTYLVQQCIEQVSKEPTCGALYLHVITHNKGAIRLYEKLGFDRVQEIPNYYDIHGQKYPCYLYAKYFHGNQPDKETQSLQQSMPSLSYQPQCRNPRETGYNRSTAPTTGGSYKIWTKRVWSFLQHLLQMAHLPYLLGRGTETNNLEDEYEEYREENDMTGDPGF